MSRNLTKRIIDMNKKPSKQYINCNHHHELTDNHEIVDFGDGEFVANKKAIPLLKALNELGIRTRTHHITDETQWFSILLDNVSVEIRTINELDSTRTKYNSKKEMLLTIQKP